MYDKVMKALIVNALSAYLDVDALMIKRYPQSEQKDIKDATSYLEMLGNYWPSQNPGKIQAGIFQKKTLQADKLPVAGLNPRKKATPGLQVKPHYQESAPYHYVQKTRTPAVGQRPQIQHILDVRNEAGKGGRQPLRPVAGEFLGRYQRGVAKNEQKAQQTRPWTPRTREGRDLNLMKERQMDPAKAAEGKQMVEKELHKMRLKQKKNNRIIKKMGQQHDPSGNDIGVFIPVPKKTDYGVERSDLFRGEQRFRPAAAAQLKAKKQEIKEVQNVRAAGKASPRGQRWRI